MIFLLVYDRRLGQLLRLEEFGDEQREEALVARLKAEHEAAVPDDSVEVVILQSDSLASLEHTHRRYFASTRDLIDRLRSA